jgi:hypothetical protein
MTGLERVGPFFKNNKKKKKGIQLKKIRTGQEKSFLIHSADSSTLRLSV